MWQTCTCDRYTPQLKEFTDGEVFLLGMQKIMKDIYKACKDAKDEYNTTLQAGANIAGFLKVAEAMDAQGFV